MNYLLAMTYHCAIESYIDYTVKTLVSNSTFDTFRASKILYRTRSCMKEVYDDYYRNPIASELHI